MKCIAILLLVSSSVLAAPIDVIQKIENKREENGAKREKKSPQMNSPFSLSPFSPFDPLASLGLSDLQLRKSEETPSEPGHQAQARNYGSISSPVHSAGAVGVFPNAKSAVAAIPLLLSCSPSIVSGQLSDTQAKPYYRSQSEMRTVAMQERSPKIQKSAEPLLTNSLESSKTIIQDKEVPLQGTESSSLVRRSVDEKQIEELKKETIGKNEEAPETLQELPLERLDKELKHLKGKAEEHTGLLKTVPEMLQKEAKSQPQSLEESPKITSADEKLKKHQLETSKKAKEQKELRNDTVKPQIEGLEGSHKIRRSADQHIGEKPLEQSEKLDGVTKTLQKINRLQLIVKKEADA